MNTNIPAQSEQPIEADLGAFKISKALSCLFNHAAPLLSESELDFIAEATNQALVEAKQMIVIIEAIGCFIEKDKYCGAFDNSTHTLLWQISNHLDLIVGLTWIGAEADVRLNKLDEEALLLNQCAK